jgi:1-acyl-sn-glycerol-3-phosphate acyltransferase
MPMNPLLGSLLFYVSLGLATLCLPLLMLVGLVMPTLPRQRLLARWSAFIVALLRVCCRLDFRVTGGENIPPGPAIILCKHQSTWETFALQAIFPPQTWVLKRELLLIPIFGWALALAQAIAIDRGSPKKALNQVISKGRDRLQKGLWVVVFPEGTRGQPGAKGKYNAGGAMLATRTGFPVVPVAHNAGYYWTAGRFRIQPGTVQIVVGPLIDPNDRRAGDVMSEVEKWIEETMHEIAP